MPLALVTDHDHRDDLGGDAPAVLAALESVGVEAVAAVWDDPDVDWSTFDGAVLRSPWDYIDHRVEFLSWAADTARRTRLANPPAVLAWNTDKRYLGDLEAAGITVTPSAFVPPGRSVAGALAGTDVVVKPAVSVGGRRTRRFRLPEQYGQATDLVARIHSDGGTALLQPYEAALDRQGETNTYVFGGQVAHTIRKSASLVDPSEPSLTDVEHLLALDQQVEVVEPTAAEAAFAQRLVEQVASLIPGHDGSPLLYARVDTVTRADGTVVLLELEATEPCLYTWLDPTGRGAKAYAEAIAAWLPR